jgi:proline iminopeptidase
MTGTRERPSDRIISDGLAIYRFGSGEPVLLMPYPHGIGSVVGPSFSSLVRGLKALGRQIVTFDPPQVGRSRRPTRLNMDEMLECAEEALTVCDLEGPVDVMGHSHGGFAALAFAIERPEHVRRLVLMGTGAGTSSWTRAPGALWNRSHPLFWHYTLWKWTLRLSRSLAAQKLMFNVIFRASFLDRTLARSRRVRRRDWLRPADPRVRWLDPLDRRVDAPRRLDYRPRLQEIRAPTLVLVGRHDPQMPPFCSEELAKGIPDARLATFERSGHYPFVEEPEAFWAAIERFLPPSRPPDHQHSRPG